MKRIEFDRKFFDIKATLFCGQVFRAEEVLNGFAVFSLDKCAYLFIRVIKPL